MLGLLLVFIAGFSVSPQAHTQDRSEGLRLVIRPAQPSYSLEDASLGNVTAVAEITNTGPERVVVAHPSVCLPRAPQEGQTIRLPDRKSWILVEVVAPDGSRSAFRNNLLRFFAPGNTDHFALGPGESAEFILGWLGPNFSLGQWEGIEAPVFPVEGEYELQVTYHNEWPVAYLTEGRLVRGIWMGELESNVVEIRVD